LPIKLCLNNHVAFSQKCTFRYRFYEASLGQSSGYQELAKASKQFLDFLDSDPMILGFADAQPDQWNQLKRYLVGMTWRTYLRQWRMIYRKTLRPLPWVRAAFAMPFIPAYYRAVTSALIHTLKSAALIRTKARFPWAYKIYRTLKESAF
jgi:hypothetical protein